MLKEEQLKELADKLKVKADDLQTAITSEEEVELVIPELKIFTPEELTARDTNITEPIKNQSYQDGKVAGVEMEVKTLRESLGLEFEGKTITNLLDAQKKQILAESGKDVDPIILELKKDKDLLTQTITQLKADHESEKNTLTGKITEQSVNVIIEAEIEKLDALPDGITKSDVIMMIRNGYQIETAEGKMIFKQNGEILKDETTADPKGAETIVAEFFESRKWTGDPNRTPGRNEKDEFGTQSSGAIVEFKKVQSADDLEKYCERHNLQPQSNTIVELMKKHMTDEQRKKVLSTKG